MDLIGPFHQTLNGNRYVPTMTDLFTKWVVVRGIPNKSAASVANVELDVIYTYGPPKRFITNQSREFVNEVSKSTFAIHRHEQFVVLFLMCR